MSEEVAAPEEEGTPRLRAVLVCLLTAAIAWLLLRPPPRVYDPFYGPDRGDIRPTSLVVHHTAVRPHGKLLRQDDPVGRIHKFHTEVRGWAAVGYHFMIGGDGDVYAGRRLTTSGAHAGSHGFNRVSAGVSMLGDREIDAASPAQYRSLVLTLHSLMRYLEIPSERVVGHSETDLVRPRALREGVKPESLADREDRRRACPGKTVDMTILRQILTTLRHHPPPPGMLADHAALRTELLVQPL